VFLVPEDRSSRLRLDTPTAPHRHLVIRLTSLIGHPLSCERSALFPPPLDPRFSVATVDQPFHSGVRCGTREESGPWRSEEGEAEKSPYKKGNTRGSAVGNNRSCCSDNCDDWSVVRDGRIRARRTCLGISWSTRPRARLGASYSARYCRGFGGIEVSSCFIVRE
jgi:hypothetical protein